MTNIDYDWVRSQFDKAHVKVGPGQAVLDLLKAWESHELDTELSKEAVEIFAQLALGYALVPDNPDEIWVDAIPGSIKRSQEVRVKANAFSDEAGRLHNGRRGKVVDIRFGDVVFRSTDGLEPFLDGTHYSPYNLQMRIQ